MAARQQTELSPSSFLNLDTLYCQEEHWEDECSRDGLFDEDDSQSYFNDNSTPHSAPLLLDQDLFWEDEELSCLILKEQDQYNDEIDTNPSFVGPRSEAVDWILKVVSYYSFNALTAVLAVNYLDRFLFSFQFQREKPWMTQLAAVSCLSLAAKVEETQVPLLLDLQVEESKYVFEAKTIQRMEILILTTLQWKMNPVTPLSFLDYITRRLGLNSYLCFEFLKRCESLLLCFISDYRYRCYLPSVIATATMLHVIDSLEPCIRNEYQTQLLGILGIDKDKVEECSKLIHELTSRGYGRNFNKRKFGSVPGSPNGVMDLSLSSDSSNESWAVAVASVSSSPEPHSKKMRVQEHATGADILSIRH